MKTERKKENDMAKASTLLDVFRVLYDQLQTRHLTVTC
jgi:hypothetical protein